MNYALLCSGSKGNSFLIQDENTFLLIDCGRTQRYLKTCLETLEVKPEDIDAILITHNHSDHISSIKMFEGYRIYSPIELPGVSSTFIQPQKPFAVGHLTITPVALSHDAPNTVGYVIESAFEKLVYITDTGYVASKYLPLLKGADYIVLESNHDVSMLMESNRPMYLKQRIASDSGHLCNEDCAGILNQIVTRKTKGIILAHLSEECNKRELALETSRSVLEKHSDKREDLVLMSAGQKEMIIGGIHEKVDYGSCYCTFGVEPRSFCTVH